MNKEQSERFQHWQQKTIDQFTQVVNILLLISSAFLGYLVSLKINNILKVPLWSINSLLILTTSIIMILVFLSYNRLKDFRLTKNKIKFENISIEKIRKIGKNSWRLLYLSLLLFFIDVFSFLIIIINT